MINNLYNLCLYLGTVITAGIGAVFLILVIAILVLLVWGFVESHEKKQRLIHLVVPVLQTIAVLIAWHYVPPYLAENGGIQLLLAVFILSEPAHYILHDK